MPERMPWEMPSAVAGCTMRPASPTTSRPGAESRPMRNVYAMGWPLKPPTCVAPRAGAVEQRVVERASPADDGGGRLAARHDDLAVTRGHEPQPDDAVGVRLDRAPYAELAQRADAAGRHAAAARLVAREVGTVHEHDVANAELAQSQRGRRPGGPRPDDRDGRAPHDSRPRSAPPAWRRVETDSPRATRVRAASGRRSAPRRRRVGSAWRTTCAYSRTMIDMRPSCVDSSAIDTARPRGLRFQ